MKNIFLTVLIGASIGIGVVSCSQPDPKDKSSNYTEIEKRLVGDNFLTLEELEEFDSVFATIAYEYPSVARLLGLIDYNGAIVRDVTTDFDTIKIYTWEEKN